MKNDAKKIIDRYDRAIAERQKSDHLRQEAGKYAWPMAKDVSPHQYNTEGNVNRQELFSSVAINASYRAASGIFSYLMPVGDRWFNFEPQDYELSEDEELTRYLAISSNILHDEIWRSNFQREMMAAIRSIVVFGFGTISVQKSGDGGLQYRAHHVGDIAFEENSDGQIDTVFRAVRWNARQVVQQFGDDAPEEAKKAAKAGRDESFDFVHAVYPREDYKQGNLDDSGKKYKADYIYLKDKEVIATEGFDEMPYCIGRFSKAPDETYGRSPVTENLQEIKMLNAMAETFIISSEKAANPPIIMEDDSVVGTPDQGPLGIIYIRQGSMEPMPIKTGTNPQLNAMILERQEQKIEQALFNHLFQTLADYRNMTATEVIGRREEALTMLSPSIVSLQKEMFDPLISRSLKILQRSKNRMPPAPIVGEKEVGIDIKYLGRLALAMSKNQANAAIGFLNTFAPYMEAVPELASTIKWAKMMRETGVTNGVKPEWLKTEDEVAEEMQAQREMQMEQQAVETGETGSKALLNVAKAGELGGLL